ncbi:MAG: 4Fe-4S dicluster domain-containing protein [Candidatus Aminicenantes bacterium]|nr:4Fe-4S dicluster domain-containing protein [Candidatus Aminicenantes bacterium]
MAPKIVLTADNVAFLKKICDLSGQIITKCDQCGTCTASCPMVAEMDITPAQMMRMVQLGQREVMETKAMWACASCFSCTARCPRGLDLAKVAEALRQVMLRLAIDEISIMDIPEDEIKRLPQIAMISAGRKFTG